MARLTRPLALATSGLGVFSILCAILLLTAGSNTATSGIQLLSVDTTNVGSQIRAWFQNRLGAVGVLPENIIVDFVPGAVRRVYYMGDVGGTLAGNTSLTFDVLGQQLPQKTYEHSLWGTEWAAISVSNGTGSAIIGKTANGPTEAAEEIDFRFGEMLTDFRLWNESDSATINPQPAAGLLITGTVLQAGTVAVLCAVALGALALGRVGGFAVAGLATVGGICDLASAAWITKVLRAYGDGAKIQAASYGYPLPVPIAIVPYSTSGAFWALIWLNAVSAIFVAGLAVGLAVVAMRGQARTRQADEKELPDEA